MNPLFAILCAIGMGLHPSIAFSDPGILPQYSFNKGGEYIHATGSWVGDFPGSRDPYFKDFALQTSEIACYKTPGVCFEARAVSKGPVMYSSLIEYKIIEWNTGKMVAVLEGAAATIELTVDLTKDLAFLTNKPKPGVDRTGELIDHARLDDGMKAIQRATGK